MKRILGLLILSGFVLMLGAAGSADFANMSFTRVICLELCGMFIVLFGTSALMHYKRYIRRMMKKRTLLKKNKVGANANFGVKIRVPEKELC